MAASEASSGSRSRSAEDLILYLYVDSILRTGIVSDNLTSAKSNSELVRSLESLLEVSLACPKHPSKPLPPSSASPGCSDDATQGNAVASTSKNVWDGVPSLTRLDPAAEECEADPSYSVLQTKAGVPLVTIPAREAITQEPAVRFSVLREALDVTAKFFYLPATVSSAEVGAASSQQQQDFDTTWIQDSLDQLRIATGLQDVDTFIVSFPGLVFDESAKSDGQCCDDSNSRQDDAIRMSDERALEESIIKVWHTLSANNRLKSLGVSEFSLDRLKWLIQRAGSEATTGVTTTELRRPKVGQINTRKNCDVPSDLIDYAQQENVDLLVHSDCSDFLPPATFTRLLARHGARLPPALISTSAKNSEVVINGNGAQDAEGLARSTLQRLSARWVLKYTVLIRDRALVADKGYIVRAERVTA